MSWILVWNFQFNISIYFVNTQKVKLATIFKGELKAPFSLATMLRCRWVDATPFLGLLYFTLNPYFMRLSVNQGGIKYHFLSLVWLDVGLNPGLPGHWWTLYSLGQYFVKKRIFVLSNIWFFFLVFIIRFIDCIYMCMHINVCVCIILSIFVFVSV